MVDLADVQSFPPEAQDIVHEKSPCLKPLAPVDDHFAPAVLADILRAIVVEARHPELPVDPGIPCAGHQEPGPRGCGQRGLTDDHQGSRAVAGLGKLPLPLRQKKGVP